MGKPTIWLALLCLTVLPVDNACSQKIRPGSDPDQASPAANATSADDTGLDSFSTDNRFVHHLLFTPDGSHLISAGLGERDAPAESTDSPIFILDLSRSRAMRLAGHADEVLTLAVAPDGRRLLSGGKDGQMHLWDLHTGEKLQSFSGHEGAVGSISLSPNGGQALTGCDDAALRLWDVESGKLLRTYRAHTKGPLFVAYLADGKRAISGSNGDKKLRLWDLAKGKQLKECELVQRLFGIALGPDQETIQAINEHGLQAHKVDTLSGSGIGGGRSKYYMPPWLGRFAIRYDPTQPMELLDMTTYRAVQRLADKTPNATAVALSADNKKFAWATSDGKLVVGNVGERPTLPEPKVHVVDASTARQNPSTRPAGFSYSYLLLLAPRATPDKPAHEPLVVLGQEQHVAGNPAYQRHTLDRQLVRQAVLMAVREELGLLTRDAGLDEWTEPITDDSPARIRLELQISTPPSGGLKAVLRKSGSSTTLWKQEFRATAQDPTYLTRLLEAAEKWSREEIPQALKEGRLTLANRTSSPLAASNLNPKQLEERLGHMTLTDQFGALRQLHNVPGEKSHDQLGWLARANTNLGVLTEFCWTAAHKAFKARGLLYAQRLVSSQSNSREGLWHRAYAQALTGLHSGALEDLKQAEQLTASGMSVPAWVAAVDAYCRFDTPKLEQSVENQEQPQLAGLLRFLAIDGTYAGGLRLRAGREALEINPECYRIYDGMCRERTVTHLQFATGVPISVLHQTLPLRVAEIDPPKSVAALVANVDQPPMPTVIAKSLRDVAGPQQDRGEPSWAALGSLIEEVQFIQLARRADFMRNQWSVPVAGFVEQLRPQWEKHRFWAYIVQQTLSGAEQQEVLQTLVTNPDFLRLDFSQRIDLAAAWKERHRNAYSSLMNVARVMPEPTFPELAALTHAVLPEGRGSDYLEPLRRVSPHTPLAKAISVVRDQELTAERLSEIEQSSSEQPEVLTALALRYSKEKNYEAAERCLRTYMKFSREPWAYRKLASNHKAQGNIEQWKQALEEFLTDGEPGLEHAAVRVEIARYYMEHNKWDDAIPYAEEAAQSYAAWAMICAVECYQGKGDLKRADAWYARLADRYPGHDAAYLQWRRQHGLVDDKQVAAEQEERVDQFAEQAPPQEMYKAGAAYLRLGLNAKALSAFSKGYVGSSDARAKAYNGFFVLLLADELDKPMLRDEILRSLAMLHDATQQRSQQLAVLLEASLKDGAAPLDTADIDRLLDEASPEDLANLSYFTARFLKLRGRQEDANRYLIHCVGKAEDKKPYLTQHLAQSELKPTNATDPPEKPQ